MAKQRIGGKVVYIPVNKNKANPQVVESIQSAETFQQWTRSNMALIREIGLGKDPDGAENLFYQVKLEEPKWEELTKEQAIATVTDGLPGNVRDGWFRQADSAYKPKIMALATTVPGLRNAGLNIAWQNYKEVTGKNISFEKFLNTEIVVYRGGNFNFVKDDVFVSYSFDKATAQRFAGNGEVRSIRVKPRDTFGGYQTTGEAEILVLSEQMKKHLKR